MAKAVVTNIQGYSIHDGDGIRTTVFLKGCPLRCRWCANPENLTREIQIGFIKGLCTGCFRCAGVCPNGAILIGADTGRIDRSLCRSCGSCVDACYYGALVKYGDEMTATEVYDKVRRDKMFYDASGGGVTVSGGEPLTHPDFVYELFSLCRGGDISTCIETCGCVPWESFEKLLPVTDQFYFDLKSIDNYIHREYTGVSNALILDNARRLSSSGARILFRQPLIPGINDTPGQIDLTARFIKSLDGDHGLQLMPYHRMGTSKYSALDMPYTLEHLQVQPPEAAEAAARAYTELGISCTVSR